jgi:signal transduction histidine kinase
VVDDDAGLRVLLGEALQSEGYRVVLAASARAARSVLEREPADLMLLDLHLSDGNGPELVASMQNLSQAVPLIVVTGQGDERVAVEVMRRGALDYVMKDALMLELLPTVVRRALETVMQRRALAAAQAEQRRLEQEILAAGERERHAIGADLHDGLGQQLTALELMCTALKADLASNPALTERAEFMCRLLREAIAQTRFLARGLVPLGSDPDSLQIGLAELVQRTRALGRMACDFECPTPVAVHDSVAAGHLYRIAQEALHNVVKHSGATRVRVRLTREEKMLVLEVADNGSGLPKAHVPGIGLGVMEHRARVIGGKLTVASRRGRGVTITCSWPQGA